ncbi:hypothetical protein [Agrococcus sp. TF02-05]|uniref:hypothetical protein n=1 Tax=Agrococcus sp. TF02-05 TaxID=2815211 RepID=UPI001AA0F641|nr:hypothetical protein [Agrococcus sp. TF02-05]MBO1770704.1 hypothetical protein [Agrococcus sp. TF02-05]
MRSPRLRMLVEWTAVTLLAVILSAIIVGVHVARQPKISYIDEYLYIDAVDKVPTQLVVRQGEDLGELALEAISCRGIILFGPPAGAVCGEAEGLPDDVLPQGGMTSADIYPPFYAAITWAGAEAIEAVFGVEDPVDAMRLAGAIWLAPALVLLYAAARAAGIRRVAAAGSALVLLGSMPVLHAHTFVSTDSSSLLAGALMALLAMRVLAGRPALVGLVAAAVAMTLLKVQNLGAVVVAVVAILIGLLLERADDGTSPWTRLRSVVVSRTGLALGLALVLPVVAQAAWLVVRRAIAVGDAPEQGLGRELSLVGLAREATMFFYNAAGGSYSPGQIGADAVVLASVVGVMTTAGPFAAVMLGRRAARIAALGGGTIVGMLVVGPALAIATWASTGEYVQLAGRYGMPMLPAALLCFAAVLGRSRWSSWLLVAIGAGAVALSCVAVTVQ